ncbi:MAG: cobalt ECF transporter T component CbiQ [Oculatellaceae cyanobacterium Prado106]|jgi:cobalt/nickel transport system permease protein|nr:cobalt ECF transporter T component CbiQ [Oculatellaceae cyanobacterium Prado106]
MVLQILLHVGAFSLDQDSQHVTPWHRLVPRTRLVCALLFVFATALTPHGYWITWALYGLGLTLLLLISRVTLSVLLRRVAVELVFLSVVLLGTLFRGGGQVLWQWGSLQITTVGLTILGSVSIKALLCLLMMNFLVLTTSIPALLHALAELRLPQLLVAILASMYRYIAVLVGEFETMQRAATARNLMGKKRWQRLVVGNMIGALFIRTYDRSDRIHQAMLSRGYSGLPPLAEVPRAGVGDGWAIAAMLSLLLGGFLLGWVG